MQVDAEGTPTDRGAGGLGQGTVARGGVSVGQGRHPDILPPAGHRPATVLSGALATVRSMTRWIELDGVVNMRDLGGLPTLDGRTTREGRLVRSDNLQNLSPGDVRHLVESVGVTDIVDLRTDTERDLTGPGPLTETSLAHHHLSFIAEDRAPGSDAAARGRDALLLSNGEDAQRGSPDFWTRHYLGYLHRRPDSVAGSLGVIVESRGGVVVHCAAGKDRTGTVTALALSVAGVPDEEIVADYAASGERIRQIIERLVDVEPYKWGLVGRSLDEQTPRPETMQQILAALEDEYGGAAGWLREQGWDQDRLDRLRSRLVG